LWDAWLATNNDCINGARQKGKVCWAKVVQEYKERKHHKPYKMRSERMKESIQKTWTYIHGRAGSDKETDIIVTSMHLALANHEPYF
jgi:serine/threonine protein phosphatase PrpC